MQLGQLVPLPWVQGQQVGSQGIVFSLPILSSLSNLRIAILIWGAILLMCVFKLNLAGSITHIKLRTKLTFISASGLAGVSHLCELSCSLLFWALVVTFDSCRASKGCSSDVGEQKASKVTPSLL